MQTGHLETLNGGGYELTRKSMGSGSPNQKFENDGYFHLRPHLKIIPFPVDRPGEFILRLYPAAFFFFFFLLKIFNISVIFRPIFKRISPLYAELSLNYTRKKIFQEKFLFPGRPGGYFWSHPVDRKQTFFLVLPYRRAFIGQARPEIPERSRPLASRHCLPILNVTSRSAPFSYLYNVQAEKDVDPTICLECHLLSTVLPE